MLEAHNPAAWLLVFYHLRFQYQSGSFASSLNNAVESFGRSPTSVTIVDVV
jgi:hypothetical protein